MHMYLYVHVKWIFGNSFQFHYLKYPFSVSYNIQTYHLLFAYYELGDCQYVTDTNLPLLSKWVPKLTLLSNLI